MYINEQVLQLTLLTVSRLKLIFELKYFYRCPAYLVPPVEPGGYPASVVPWRAGPPPRPRRGAPTAAVAHAAALLARHGALGTRLLLELFKVI